ncbi:unnamed protein product [Caenorhabditis nigoni]
MYLIDFTEPEWLILYYYLIGGVSIIMNTLGIYLLLYQCKALGSFRYWLLAYQLLCFATDLQFTFLMQPVTLYPIIAVLANTFFLKHQSVASLLNSFVIPKFVNGIIFLVFGVVLIVFEIVLYSACYDGKDKWNYIELNYPEYFSSFQSLRDFEIVDGEKIVLIAKFLIIFGIFGSTVLLLVVIDIFRKLKVLKLKISPKNYRRHSEALRCLLVQSIAVGIAALPLLLFGISLAAENIDAQFWSEVGIASFATHSSLNMILLMIFFPPYRNFVKKKIKSLQRNSIKVHENVSAILIPNLRT